jgi:glycine betaine/proline transport system substrate-binding protein
MHSLNRLGHDVLEPKRAAGETLLSAVASGDAHFMASHLDPLDLASLKKAGNDKLEQTRPVVSRVTRGFMTDAASSIRFDLLEIDQLKNPKIAVRFDRNGNGKADLVGCAKGSACAQVIDRKIRQWGLSRTVEQINGDYDAMMTETIKLARELKPVLYYAVQPGWVVGARVPDSQAIWLAPPKSDKPGSATGFEINTLRIVSNKAFNKKNPVTAALFNEIRIPVRDLSEQNLKVHLGENSVPDIERHAREWISKNEALVDEWISQAKKKAASR